MKLSHVILKVDNLHQAVREHTEKGFVVEYGRSKDPINAMIYFSEGPFIELLDGSRMPAAAKSLMRFLGKEILIDRVQRLDDCAPGYCDLALENYEKDLNREKEFIKKYGIKCSGMPNRRVDTHGRDLRFRLLVPEVLALPFMMTYFSIDPKPANFVHPNGIRTISRIVYGTDPKWFSLIKELCDDERLILSPENGIEVEFGS